MNDQERRVSRARYELHLSTIATASGQEGIAPGPIECMREALACCFGGLTYAFPFAGSEGYIWWLCWKAEHGGRADFFGKSTYSYTVETVKTKSLSGAEVDAYEPRVDVSAEYGDLVRGYELLEALREHSDENQLREMTLGYVLTHRYPEHEAAILLRLLQYVGNEEPLSD